MYCLPAVNTVNCGHRSCPDSLREALITRIPPTPPKPLTRHCHEDDVALQFTAVLQTTEEQSHFKVSEGELKLI